jgi:hypothetical protein
MDKSDIMVSYLKRMRRIQARIIIHGITEMGQVMHGVITYQDLAHTGFQEPEM